MSTFLDNYGVVDERREKRVKRVLYTVLTLAVVGGEEHRTHGRCEKIRDVDDFDAVERHQAGAHRRSIGRLSGHGRFPISDAAAFRDVLGPSRACVNVGTTNWRQPIG